MLLFLIIQFLLSVMVACFLGGSLAVPEINVQTITLDNSTHDTNAVV